MEFIGTLNNDHNQRYNFYMGYVKGDKRPYYNIIPQHQAKPSGGYINLKYICDVKGCDFETAQEMAQSAH